MLTQPAELSNQGEGYILLPSGLLVPGAAFSNGAGRTR
jgi:hypothetical protein